MQSSGLVVHPADLSRHGKTPAGLPLYRIVWSDSRTDRIEFEGKVYTELRYPTLSGQWVMEKWIPAEKYMGMSRAEYEALFEGPMFGKAKTAYPEGGEYEYSYAWADEVDEPTIHGALEKHEFALRNRTLSERAEVLKANAEERERQTGEWYEQKLSTVFGETK